MFSSNVALITPSALTSIGKKYWLVSTPNGTHSLLAISVIRTLTYRCFRICSTPSLPQSALKDLRNPLLQNGFPQRIITFNINDVLKKNRSKPNIPISTVRKKDFIILLPYLGSESNQISKCLKSWVNKSYSIVIESQNHLTSPILFALCCAQGRKKKKKNLKVAQSYFLNTRRIKYFFAYKDRLNRSQRSKVVYKTSCWDCDDFYIGKTKRRLQDRKMGAYKVHVASTKRVPNRVLQSRYPNPEIRNVFIGQSWSRSWRQNMMTKRCRQWLLPH